MASLTHVCMWSDNGWKRITAKQASKLHPGGTVSAHSGLFMCELCGQYVILTDGDIKVRYFKHSAYEKSKNCPERTFGTGYSVYYSSQEHDLPIRIVNVSSSSFGFEVGLIRVPINSLNENLHIEIRPKGVAGICYKYKRERLNDENITYLSIGERPFERYILSFQCGTNKLHEFWPSEIKGIDPSGTLFYKDSGIKLTYDADVEIEKEYYLLKRGKISNKYDNNIQIQEILQKQFGYETWTLYLVSVSSFNENAARFYLDFHCRLTDKAVSLQPVWPLFVEDNYMIKHNQNSTYMIVRGNIVAVKTFPSGVVHQLSNNECQIGVYQISCSNRQQLISLGRSNVLQYAYFWKEPLDHIGSCPKVSVTDLKGIEVNSGESNSLPYKKTLCFKSVFDGEIIVSNNSHIIDKRKLLANKLVQIDELSYGLRIQVFVGLDIIWETEFKRQQSIITNDEYNTMMEIINMPGPQISVPHSLRSILLNMSNYPQICKWIRKCIKSGTISEPAYRKLQNFYHRINNTR